MLVIVELLPMDTMIYGPFENLFKANSWAMNNCKWPFQVKAVIDPKKVN